MSTAMPERPSAAPGFVPALAAFAISASLLASWSTSRFGTGVSPDSAHYIGAARSLAAGHGLRFNGAPFTHWPPLYPALLAALSRFGPDPLEIARRVSALLYGVNAVLVAALAFRVSNRSIGAATCSEVLFLVSPEMLHIHTMAWSEPLFFCLTLISVLILMRWTERPGPWLLAGAGLCSGLALLTRFSGSALLPPSLLCVLLQPSTGRRRIADGLAFSAIAAAPLSIWLLVLRQTAHVVSDRPLVLHPPPAAACGLLVLAALSGGALAGELRRRAPSKGGTASNAGRTWMLAFVVVYSLLVFATISLVDALTPVDARILSPALIFGGIVIVARLWEPEGQVYPSERAAATEHRGTRRRTHFIRVFASVVLCASCSRFGGVLALARARHDDGYGYTSRPWSASPTLAWIAGLPLAARIYSNAPELIAFRSRRTVEPLPELFSPTTLLPNPHLQHDTAALSSDLRGGAIVVYFLGSPRRYLLSFTDLEAMPHVRVVRRLPDGVVYGHAAQGRPGRQR